MKHGTAVRDGATATARAPESMGQELNLAKALAPARSTDTCVVLIGPGLRLTREECIDSRIQEALDQYFHIVDLSNWSHKWLEISFTMKQGVVPKEAVAALDTLNERIHEYAIKPSSHLEFYADKLYHEKLSVAYSGACVIGVPGSGKKTDKGMRSFLADRDMGMHLSSRFNSIVCVTLNLLVPGINAFEDGIEYRDDLGILYVEPADVGRGMTSHYYVGEGDKRANKNLLALGTPNYVRVHALS